MPAPKPTDDASFADAAAAPDREWPLAVAVGGYLFKQVIQYEHINGLFNRIGDWTKYLKDFAPSHSHRGDASDYDSPQIIPETEVFWGVNGEFFQVLDDAADVVFAWLHGGAGASTLLADKIFAGIHAYSASVRSSLTVDGPGDAQVDFTVDGAIASLAIGVDSLFVAHIQKILGSTKQHDQHLFRGNLVKAVYHGTLNDDGAGDLVEDAVVHSYNMSFNGPTAPGGNTWDFTIPDSTSILGLVFIKITSTSEPSIESFVAMPGFAVGTSFYSAGVVRMGFQRHLLKNIALPDEYRRVKVSPLVDNVVPAIDPFIVTIMVI